MVNYVAVGAIAVVLVILVIAALDRWNVFGDDRENPDSGTDRIKHEEKAAADYSVSWLKKHKTLTLPAKVVTIAIGGIVISTGVYAYFTLKNGAPAEVPYANAVKSMAIAIIGISGGVAYRGRKDRNRGKLEIIYEDDDGSESSTEIVWFGRGRTETNEDGNPVVFEHFETRILGLFGRRKLVAHDRELRTEATILSDAVSHEIANHAVRIDDGHWVMRTQGHQTSGDPSDAANYTYRSPINMPYESYLRVKERNSKLETKLDTKDAILAATQSELTDLRRRLETREYRSVEDAREEIMDTIERVPTGTKQVEVRADNRPERMPSEQRDLDASGGNA
ncbi:hypothetical protein [Haloarcula sediminis]|uniref:hypothetical protein n=1 Tax=Haloarcula sediminis TaxID=3111777 RepID=UPI002D7A10D4|nr:hypothetical protein [Haloarcula sp. CK38]